MARSNAAVATANPAASFSIEEQRAITSAQLAAPGEAPGRPQDFLFQQRQSTMERRIANTPIRAATVINFLPSQLMVNSSMPDLQVRIRGCQIQDEYTAHTWDKPIIEVIMAGGVRTPNDYVPRQIAEEYVREYTTENGPGGVMLFDGTLAEFERARESDPDVQERVEATRQQAIAYMKMRVNEAESAWNTPDHRMANNITDLHRMCAARLEKVGVMGNSKPEWMDIVRSQRELVEPCPLCKTEPKHGAAICKECNYVLKPADAFHAGLIDEYSLQLERLTREAVQKLGISDYVAETVDERPARLKRGETKPLSAIMAKTQAAIGGNEAVN